MTYSLYSYISWCCCLAAAAPAGASGFAFLSFIKGLQILWQLISIAGAANFELTEYSSKDRFRKHFFRWHFIVSPIVFEYPAVNIGSADFAAAAAAIFRNGLADVLTIYTDRWGGKKPVPRGKLRRFHLNFSVFNFVTCKLKGGSKSQHNLVKNVVRSNAAVTGLQIKIEILNGNLLFRRCFASTGAADFFGFLYAVRRHPAGIVADISDGSCRTAVSAPAAMVDTGF
jgi:hypothetical protein